MKKIARWAGSLFLAAVLCAGGWYLYNFKTGNFHAITPNEAYRSAQLDQDQLKYYIAKYHIRTIVNLRGKEPGAKWYDDEIKTSAACRVQHYDVALSAVSEPTDRDIDGVIRIFKSAPRPLLLHCLGGADRSGLAAVIWKVVVDKEPESRASSQLTVFYGHLPFGKTAAMNRWLDTHRIDRNDGKITDLSR